MQAATRGKERRNRPVVHVPGGSLEEAWAEIRRLRGEMDRIRATRLNPKFGGVVLDGVGTGAGVYSLGFEPRFIYFFGNFGASSTAATIAVGGAVVDENVDGGIYQASTSMRRSSGGQFRSSSLVLALIAHGNDSDTPDRTLSVDSFDIDGFSYTIAGASFTVLRGFAMGF